MRKKIIITIIILIMTVLLSSCWDLKDIDNRAIVLAIGIDYADKPHASNYESSDQIAVSLQLANIQRQAGANAPRGEEAVTIITGTGKNISMAMTHLQERLQYKLFLGHVKVLIFNQEVAKNGINKYFNYFRNSAQFNRRSYLLISRNKAVEVLKSVPGNATIPAMYLFNVVDRSLTQGKMPEVPIIDFIIKLEKKGIDPKAIMIDSTEKDLRYIGTAVFRGDRLVGHLNLHESWDLIRLTEGKVGGEIDVQDVEDELGKIALEIINIKKNKMWVEIAEDGNYILKINMRIEGRIVSQEIKNDYSKMELFRQLENRAAKEIARDMVEMIYKTQKKYQADIFGFGKEVQAFLPQEWKRIHNWRNKFINSTIDLNVKFCLRRTGMSYFRGH